MIGIAMQTSKDHEERAVDRGETSRLSERKYEDCRLANAKSGCGGCRGRAAGVHIKEGLVSENKTESKAVIVSRHVSSLVTFQTTHTLA
jgi:hypothetical protein